MSKKDLGYRLTAYLNINSSKYYRFKKDDLLKEREKIIKQLTSSDLKPVFVNIVVASSYFTFLLNSYSFQSNPQFNRS